MNAAERVAEAREIERRMRSVGDRLLGLLTHRDQYSDLLWPRTRGPHGPAWVRPIVRLPTRGALDADRYETLLEALGLVREEMARAERELDRLATELRALLPPAPRSAAPTPHPQPLQATLLGLKEA